MRMTARAVGGCADKRRHGLSNQIIPVQVRESNGRGAEGAEIECTRAEIPKRSGQTRFVRIKIISGKLLSNEARPGGVFVERFNHVIPEAPGIVPADIMFVTVRISKVNGVQPMPRPALAISR